MTKYTHKWTLKRSWLWFGTKVIAKWLEGRPSLLYVPGVHLLHGPSGSGKSLLANIMIHELLRKGGFVWCNIDEFHHPRVRVFDMNKVFKDGEQKMRLNKFLTIDGKKEKCVAVIIDELNQKFNRRMNKSTVYNEQFVPLISFIVTHRHQIADRVYLLGQSLLLQDGQIQSIIKMRHDVRSKKGWHYWFWRENLEFVFAPKKIKVTHYNNIDIDNLGNVIWWKIKQKTTIKVMHDDLTSFNTHAFEELFDHLPPYIG
jgi:hypothetical protein